MTFSDGVLSRSEADERFDRMVALCAEVSFAKQAIVELSSGVVVGYTGVDWIELDGHRWLEWGYRLVAAARGKGYATEATEALLRLPTGSSGASAAHCASVRSTASSPLPCHEVSGLMVFFVDGAYRTAGRISVTDPPTVTACATTQPRP